MLYCGQARCGCKYEPQKSDIIRESRICLEISLSVLSLPAQDSLVILKGGVTHSLVLGRRPALYVICALCRLDSDPLYVFIYLLLLCVAVICCSLWTPWPRNTVRRPWLSLTSHLISGWCWPPWISVFLSAPLSFISVRRLRENGAVFVTDGMLSVRLVVTVLSRVKSVEIRDVVIYYVCNFMVEMLQIFLMTTNIL